MASKKKRATTKPKTVAYLRVSRDEQDTGKFHHDVLAYANARDLGRVTFVEECVSGAVSWRNRQLGRLVEDLHPGDVLLTPELSRLGRSLVEILELLKECRDKGVAVFSIKEGFQANGDGLQAKVMTALLGLFAEVERDLIRQRVREGLAARKAKGIKLGRPFGPGKSKLDPHREEIVALLRNGSTKTWVARRYKTTVANLRHWMFMKGVRP